MAAPVDAPAVAPVTVPVISEDPIIQKIVELGLTQSRVQGHAHYLTEVIGPRLTASHALMDAEAWARGQFESWGLAARLEPWGSYPVGFDRGPQGGGMISPQLVPYEFITPSWTPGLSGPARGKAVMLPESLKQIARSPDQYRGVWIVEHARDSGPTLEASEREAMESRLRELGVLGYISPDRDARGEVVHTFGRHIIEWGALPDDVRINLRSDQHADLVQRLAAEQAVLLEFSIDNRFFRGPVQLYNVVADIPGTEKPDEYVIIGGHIDSWDGATGAVDNASGVATAMEAARLLMAAGARPKRTIRFMLWSGEEQGLYGSAAYVAAHPALHDKISGVFVHDGGTNYLSGLRVTPEMRNQVETALAPLKRLAPSEKPFTIELTDHLRPGSSDHDSFLAAGIPGFFWNQSGRSKYPCMHHTQLDEFPMIIDGYQRHSAVVQAVTALQIANADELLDRRNALPVHRRQLNADHDWAKIKKVHPGGKAAKLRLRPGDVIKSVDGVAVSTSSRTRSELNRGAPVKVLKVARKNREFEVTIDFSRDAGEIEAQKVRSQRETEFGAELFQKIARAREAAHGGHEPVDCSAEVEAHRAAEAAGQR